MRRLAMDHVRHRPCVLLIFGLIDFVTKYNWAQGDQDPCSATRTILLNDGATVLIAGGFLAVGAILMWVVALRREHGDQQQQPAAAGLAADDISFAYLGASTAAALRHVDLGVAAGRGGAGHRASPAAASPRWRWRCAA